MKVPTDSRGGGTGSWPRAGQGLMSSGGVWDLDEISPGAGPSLHVAVIMSRDLSRRSAGAEAPGRGLSGEHTKEKRELE